MKYRPPIINIMTEKNQLERICSDKKAINSTINNKKVLSNARCDNGFPFLCFPERFKALEIKIPRG